MGPYLSHALAYVDSQSHLMGARERLSDEAYQEQGARMTWTHIRGAGRTLRQTGVVEVDKKRPLPSSG